MFMDRYQVLLLVAYRLGRKVCMSAFHRAVFISAILFWVQIGSNISRLAVDAHCHLLSSV
jgi:hypothetical protein